MILSASYISQFSGLCSGSSVCTTSSTRRNIWCTARSDIHDKVVSLPIEQVLWGITYFD